MLLLAKSSLISPEYWLLAGQHQAAQLRCQRALNIQWTIDRMYTRESLRLLSKAASIELEALGDDDSSSDEVVCRLKSRIDETDLCLRWMISNDHDCLLTVGPFGDVPYEVGERIRIRPGATLHSLSTGQIHQVATSRRPLFVTVREIQKGFVDFRFRQEIADVVPGDGLVKQSRVLWLGAEKVTRWVDVSDTRRQSAKR